MDFAHSIGNTRYTFGSLRELLAKATTLRSGDLLAGVAASSAEERVAAQFALADVPLSHFLSEQVVPYETDELTRLIVDTHNAGGIRAGALTYCRRVAELAAVRRGKGGAACSIGTVDLRQRWPRFAVSKLMRVQDLITVAAAKIRVVTRFRTTVGLAGRLSARLQPNHPTD